MSEFFEQLRALIRAGEIRISENGYDELAKDELTVRKLLEGIDEMVVVEKYQDYPKSPCFFVLQRDRTGAPVHVVLGVTKGYDKPAVLVTVYWSDPAWWDNTFTIRWQL
jgi:hypothetical protein